MTKRSGLSALLRCSCTIPLPVLTMFLIIRCESKSTYDRHTVTTDSVVLTKEPTGGATTANNFEYTDCIRGQAKPVTNKTVFPDASFKLNADHLTGTETIALKDGAKLIINNWGCEYYLLTFRFETNKFEADTTNTVFWLNSAVILMKEIEKGIDAPLDIRNGIEAIALYLASLDSQTYTLGEEIVYDHEVITDFVTLDKVQRINDSWFAIEITFGTGPL